MAIGGAFLGGGVEVVPAGSCKLELEILTEDRANLAATFTIKGTSTYTVTAGADGRAVYTVPAGQTYTVSVNTTGYDNLASQTVIAESGTVRYVRFEAFAGRVKRTGDTMTGILSITSTSGTPRLYLKHPSLDITTTPSTNCFIDLEYLDKNNKRFALIESLAGGNSSTRQIGLMINSSTVSDKDTWSRLQLTHDGTTAYATAPSWSVGTNDNSDKVMTIKMANSLPSLVHTTGNETIAGSKRFSQGLIRLHEAISAGSVPTTDQYVPVVNIQDPFGSDFGYIRWFAGANSKLRLLQMEVNKLNDDGSTPENSFLQLFAEDENGPARATAPTTPTNASGTEIVTANWAYDKFQRKITYGTGDPPSGGQAGDIYIKI